MIWDVLFWLGAIVIGGLALAAIAFVYMWLDWMSKGSH